METLTLALPLSPFPPSTPHALCQGGATTPWYIMSSEHPHTLEDHVKAWQEHELHREAGVRERKQRFEAEMSRIMTKKVDNIALSSREHMMFMRQMYLEAVSAKTYSI